ncbi:MAG: polyphenol oxidase family protein [Christensenellales bacterium]|jgi:YfiH family protein
MPKDWFDGVSRGMKYVERDGVGLYTSPKLDEYPVAYAITTRKGGVTKSECGSLNLSYKRKDIAENVRRNFRIAAAAAGVNEKTLTCANYVHGDATHICLPSDIGAGVWRDNDLPICDAVATRHKGISLVTLHADCVPATIYDTSNHAACLCHAGWRGTLAYSVTKAFGVMESEFHSRAENCIGIIGPCICRDCYEVGEDLAKRFYLEFGEKSVLNGGIHIDLSFCTAEQFRRIGFLPENVIVAGVCTYCNADMYSFRRDGENTGAFAQMMELK